MGRMRRVCFPSALLHFASVGVVGRDGRFLV